MNTLSRFHSCYKGTMSQDEIFFFFPICHLNSNQPEESRNLPATTLVPQSKVWQKQKSTLSQDEVIHYIQSTADWNPSLPHLSTEVRTQQQHLYTGAIDPSAHQSRSEGPTGDGLVLLQLSVDACLFGHLTDNECPNATEQWIGLHMKSRRCGISDSSTWLVMIWFNLTDSVFR